MNPVKTRESNFVFKGPTPDISDLHCRQEENPQSVSSIWVFTEDERKRIASGENLRLVIYGMQRIPPVSLSVSPPVGPTCPILAPCSICGKEADDPEHLFSGQGHAYKAKP